MEIYQKVEYMRLFTINVLYILLFHSARQVVTGRGSPVYSPISNHAPNQAAPYRLFPKREYRPMNTPVVTSFDALQKCMAKAGWEIAHIDLDLTGERPKAEIRLERCDGRWLLARVDRLGRAYFETFHRDRTLRMSASTTGRRPLSPQVEDIFLGRHPCLGARNMLKQVTAYVADNGTTPVPLEEMRQAWAAVMGAPLRLTASCDDADVRSRLQPDDADADGGDSDPAPR